MTKSRSANANARISHVAAVLAMVGLSACGGNEVRYELVFPSTNSFLLTQLASVTVYDAADANPDQVCRALSVGKAADAQSIQSTGDQDVCEFLQLEGEVSKVSALENLPVGRLIFFAKATDRNGDALLRGCTVADVYPETEVIQIQMATLPQYPPELPSTLLDPACTSVQQKCTTEGLVCDIRD